MESIFINYKDIQFLTKLSTDKAKELIFDRLDSNEKEKLENSPNNVKSSHLIDANQIILKTNSPMPSIHGQNRIILLIENIRDNWSCSLIRKECLEDLTNLVRGGIYGKYITLKKILSKEEISDTEEILRRRKQEYLTSGNKVPKSLSKYLNQPAL